MRSRTIVFAALCALMLCACSTHESMKKENAVTASIDIDALWDYSKPVESEQRFREALTRVNADDTLELETQIARTYSLRRDQQKALAILDEVEKKITPTTTEAVRVRVALERGRSLRTPKNFEIARPHFQEAYDRALSANLTLLAIDAAHMFGFSKDFEEAQRWNRHALDLAMSIEHPRAIRWRASIANNLGVSERERGNLDAAMTHFQLALKSHLAQSKPPQILIAHWQVANVHRLQGRIDEALAIQLRLEKEADEANAPDVYIYTELAELFDAQHNVKQDAVRAKTYAAKALALAGKDSWMMENETKLVERMRALQRK
jgi:tetratricopeptide (TPR) repeat protein